MRVLKSFPYDRIGSWKNNNPFVILFVYTRKHPKGFIVKGGSKEVDAFMGTLTEPRMVFRTWWHRGESRDFFCLENFKVRLYLMKSLSSTEIDFSLIVQSYERNKTQVVKKIKRIPRKWMKELNSFT